MNCIVNSGGPTTVSTRLLYCVECTQYSIRLESVRIMQQLFLWAHPERKRYLDRFRIFFRAHQETNRQTDHATRSFTIGGMYVDLRSKGKERTSIYIEPFVYYIYLKALRCGSHSCTGKYTMPAFPS